MIDTKLETLVQHGLDLHKLIIDRVDEWQSDGFTYLEAIANVREEISLVLDDLHAAYVESKHE